MRTDKLIRVVLFTPSRVIQNGGGAPTADWGLPVILWGEPGTAKTVQVERAAGAAGMPCYTLSPAAKGEGAFGVVPVPVDISGDVRLTFPMPEWTDQMRERGVLFLDELADAPPSLQPALHGMLQFRDVGAGRLGGGVRVIAASNPSECSTTGQVLRPAVANRCLHVHADPGGASEYAAWLLGDGGDSVTVASDPAAEEQRVLALYPRHWAAVRGMLAAFLRARPELLHAMPASNHPAAGRAWPSRRSWALAARAWAGARAHHLPVDEQYQMVSAAVGDAPVVELAAFCAALDIPDAEDVLDGRVPFTHRSARADITVAVLSACAALVVGAAPGPQRTERAGVLWELFGSVMAAEPDLIVVPASTLCSVPGGGVECRSKAATRVLAKIRPALESMGVT